MGAKPGREGPGKTEPSYRRCAYWASPRNGPSGAEAGSSGTDPDLSQPRCEKHHARNLLIGGVTSWAAFGASSGGKSHLQRSRRRPFERTKPINRRRAYRGCLRNKRRSANRHLERTKPTNRGRAMVASCPERGRSAERRDHANATSDWCCTHESTAALRAARIHIQEPRLRAAADPTGSGAPWTVTRRADPKGER